MLFYEIFNDITPVHRLFLNPRCGERSTSTHPVSSGWHPSSCNSNVNQSFTSKVMFISESYINSATRIVPSSPGHHGLCSQGGELSYTREGFLFDAQIQDFLPVWTLFRCPEASESKLCPLKLKSTNLQWTYLLVFPICLGVEVRCILVGNKWSSSTPKIISNLVGRKYMSRSIRQGIYAQGVI